MHVVPRSEAVISHWIGAPGVTGRRRVLVQDLYDAGLQTNDPHVTLSAQATR